MIKNPKIALVRAPYRKHIIDMLDGAIRDELSTISASIESFDVHGAFEIPVLISMLEKSEKDFDAYITMGCILKGETIHDEVIAYPVYEALNKMQIDQNIVIGNAILTTNTIEQAEDRARKQTQFMTGAWAVVKSK